MRIDGWNYYNHAAIPACAPHEGPDLSPIENGEIWKMSGRPLLARWTTDFDCGVETSWWYVIKDTPFDMDSLKAKRRYEIRKGVQNFDVRRLVDPAEYGEDLYKVQVEAFSAYPAKYRPTVEREQFLKEVCNWRNAKTLVYGAFSRADNRLCGYAYLTDGETILNFNVLKTCPDSEKFGVNAAIVYQILQEHTTFFDQKYICDGSRSISHETGFQDYLEKYFGFRKAYCKLCVIYNPKIKWLIMLLYRFRKILSKFDHIGLVHKINGIVLMQEIVERQD